MRIAEFFFSVYIKNGLNAAYGQVWTLDRRLFIRRALFQQVEVTEFVYSEGFILLTY